MKPDKRVIDFKSSRRVLYSFNVEISIKNQSFFGNYMIDFISKKCTTLIFFKEVDISYIYSLSKSACI